MENIFWARYLGATAWLYAIVSVIHYFTLFIVVGTSVVVDLRVLGLAGRRKPLVQFAEQIYPWMWASFWLAMISGLLLFSTDAGDFLPDKVFEIKMSVIALAVIFVIIVRRSIPKWGQLPSIPTTGKFLAFFSLLLWFGAVLAGLEVAGISGLG